MSHYKANKKLLPCPFCQGEAEILPAKPVVPSLKCWVIRCIRCDANRKVFTNYMSQVVAEWNFRTPAKETKD